MFDDLVAASMAADLEKALATPSAAMSLESLSQSLSQNQTWLTIAFVLLNIWTLVWKGLALWKAGQLKQKVWFVLLLVINTMGLLEIAYVFFLSKVDWNKLAAKFQPPTKTQKD